MSNHDIFGARLQGGEGRPSVRDAAAAAAVVGQAEAGSLSSGGVAG